MGPAVTGLLGETRSRPRSLPKRPGRLYGRESAAMMAWSMLFSPISGVNADVTRFPLLVVVPVEGPSHVDPPTHDIYCYNNTGSGSPQRRTISPPSSRTPGRESPTVPSRPVGRRTGGSTPRLATLWDGNGTVPFGCLWCIGSKSEAIGYDLTRAGGKSATLPGKQP